MTPEEFKTWRKHLGLTQTQAAEALGLSLRAIQYYERGEREITRTVALACAAVEAGLAVA